jgi:hypothetical protein
MAKNTKVERPTKKSEYQIRFASVNAQKGWRDLVATMRGPVVDAWEFLTRTPLAVTPTNYPLKDGLATISRAGVDHQRWQYKPTAKGTAGIWFYVEEQVVYLEQVHTHHPNETK